MSRNTTQKAPRHSAPAIKREALIDAVRQAARTDGLALYHLTNIVRLAAFACESRRVSTGLDDSNSWSDFDDVTGEVLQHVAFQMDALQEAMNNRPFELLKKIDSLGGT